MFRFWEQSPKQKIEQLIERGETQKAFNELSHIIDETTSNDPFFLEMRARCAMMLSMTTTAIFDLSKLLIFQKLAQIEKDHLLAVRAAAYLRIGDYENAFKDGQKAFSSSKNDYNLQILSKLINEANFLIGQQNITEKSIIRLLSISPESPVALYKASNFYLQNKNFDEFDKYSQLFLKYDPTNSEILMSRSKYLMCQASNFDESLSVLLSCSNGCQELQDNYTYLNNFLNGVRDGNYSRIESLLNKSSEIINSICGERSKLRKFIKFINMTLLYKQNQLESAYDIVEEIIKDDPQDVNAIISKADILFEVGDFESALEAYQQGLLLISSFNPENNYRIQKKISVCERIIEKQKNLSPYQILRIPNDSDLKTANSSYQKLVVEWNPDNFKSSLYKNVANKKIEKFHSAFKQLLLSFGDCEQQKNIIGENSASILLKKFQKGAVHDIYYFKDFKNPVILQRF